MPVAKLTSKGQITIPIKIRAYLEVHTGDEIEFLIEKSGKVVIEPLTSDISELKGLLVKPKKKISIEQMNKAIAARGGEL